MKAFDCLDHSKLWKIFKDHLSCLLRNLYAGQEGTVRTWHRAMKSFKFGKGVCQGCILSPCLFHFFAEHIMWNIELNKAQAAIKNGHESLGDGEGQGSLVCSSPRGCKEVDTTEWPNNNCFLIASHNFSFKAFKVFKCLAYHGIWNVVSGLCVCVHVRVCEVFRAEHFRFSRCPHPSCHCRGTFVPPFPSVVTM